MRTWQDEQLEKLRDRTVKIDVPHLEAWQNALIKNPLSEQEKLFLEQLSSEQTTYKRVFTSNRKPLQISVEVEE